MRKGVTLIELLIVISILVILAVIFAMVFIGPAARARDSGRLYDSDRLRKNLEIYRSENDKYPQTNDPDNWKKLEDDTEANGPFYQAMITYLKNIPQDPLNGKENHGFWYKTANNGDCYKIHIEMEKRDPYEISGVCGGDIAYIAPAPSGGGGSPPPSGSPGSSPSPSPTPGPDGYALQFNGADTYVSIGDSDSLDIVDEISIEAWVKANSASTVWRSIFAKKCDFAECYGMLVENNQYIAFFVEVPVGSVSWIENYFPTGQWIHVVGTWDRTSPNNIAFFFDGQSVGDGAVGRTALPISTLPAYIGGGTDYDITQSPYYFDGSIDNLRIYAKRLPANVVAAHYNSDYSQDGTGCGGGSCDLRAAWNFNEGSGTAASDSSGNGNMGTLINNPQWISVP